MTNTKTVSQLIESLQSVMEEYGDVPVLVANQPSYPLTNTVNAINVLEGEEEATPSYPSEGEKPEEGVVCWIGVEQPGSWTDIRPYAPRAAWEDRY